MENNNNGQQGPQGTLVNVKRVRQEEDTKGRQKVVLTFGLDQDGNNGLDSLLDALTALRGKQANVDIRISKKTSSQGVEFDTAFVIVKEMIPKAAGAGAPAKGKFVPKNQAKATELKARAKAIQESLE